MKTLLKTLISFVLLGACHTSMAQKQCAFKSTYSYVRSDGRKAKIRLKQVSDSLSLIQYFIGREKRDEWALKHPVYQFECGDITGDSIPEIAVGVIKTTRYSHFMGRRLFIFKLFDEDVIRPLWLGSRVSHELIDFHIEHLDKGNLIHTVEKNKEGEVLELRYKLSGFGLKFVEYLPSNNP